jgi:hypothetical protein
MVDMKARHECDFQVRRAYGPVKRNSSPPLLRLTSGSWRVQSRTAEIIGKRFISPSNPCQLPLTLGSGCGLHQSTFGQLFRGRLRARSGRGPEFLAPAACATQPAYKFNNTRKSEKQIYAAILLRARPRETSKSAEM